MRYSLLISFFIIICGCRSLYPDLKESDVPAEALMMFKPQFTSALYKAEVNVAGRYLSGLLIFKQMEDSSLRIVFSNEFGIKYFDFEFTGDGQFKVHYLIRQMDKSAVKKTLRKDFSLLLMNHFTNKDLRVSNDSTYIYFTFVQGKDVYRYVTTQTIDSLVRMERSGKRKRVAEARLIGSTNVPDSISITHTNFNFNIALKKIIR